LTWGAMGRRKAACLPWKFVRSANLPYWVNLTAA